MIVLRSLASAFLMYSRIPMPQVEWKEENRRYALCFFPLIGAVIGTLLLLWEYVCGLIDIGLSVKAAVCVLLPILVTGGIHIDGFCDTTDALASCADRQKKLAIMSDPHIGSFAAIGLCSMLLLQFALFCEVGNYAVIAVGYVLSRALSGLAAVTLKSAKSEGALQNFVKPAHKRITIAALALVIILCITVMLFIGFCEGISVCIAAALCLVIYRSAAYRNFGGITGDTEGWYLQITETVILAAVFTAEKVVMIV
ncbi:MAG: adenosylcobinamide-GDP ribazoletransferase [Oscillospiraceae bacterium]|nr:adenosylcobinamide-GDP ribazoletransferase [Oscillospiraceae bacterium]